MAIAARRLHSTRPGLVAYQLVLPTDLAQVGHAVEAVVSCCSGPGPLSSRTRFRLRTVAAEAIANAMTYGNGNDPDRQVTVEVELADGVIRVAVTDEGRGFDPALVRELSEPEHHDATSGRGLFMIRRLADRVEFNERGNTIWMTLPRH
jgi:serine/threonine-protein kinase RsbW